MLRSQDVAPSVASWGCPHSPPDPTKAGRLHASSKARVFASLERPPSPGAAASPFAGPMAYGKQLTTTFAVDGPEEKTSLELEQ
jgi:hypothetical protein